MLGMFQDCSSLKVLDVSSFNTDKITEIYGIFRGCTNLITIYSDSNWETGLNVSSKDMFRDCVNLVGIVSYSSSNANDITFANPTTGYFTKKEA